MRLPASRGPVSAAIIAALHHHDVDLLPQVDLLPEPADPVADDDLQLSLWVCYELHYRGFDAVDDDWEWEPDLIRVRRALENQLLAALYRDVPVGADPRPVPQRLWDLVDSDDGPSLSRQLQKHGGVDLFREFAMHRSIYQHKEADPHTWAIPRLAGRTKAALVEIQYDEYGDGRVEAMHSELFRVLLRGLDLDDSYAAYLDDVPGITLAIGNVMSLFGLRRSLRGALVGHLAAYEMTSSAPCRRYAQGLRRLGFDDETCDFYDVHVTADALHEQLAAYDLCGSLATAEPELTEQIVFGAAACLHVDGRFAEHVLDRWSHDESSLRTRPLAPVRPLVPPRPGAVMRTA